MVRRSWLLYPVGLILSTHLILLIVGAAVGYGIFKPRASSAEAQSVEQALRITEIETVIASQDGKIDALLSETTELLKERVSLGHKLEAVTSDLEKQQTASRTLQGEISVTAKLAADAQMTIDSLKGDVTELKVSEDQLAVVTKEISQLESHRLLLIELRKDMPETRSSAISYWHRVKSLAVKADPSLGSKADRVIRLIPAYFDWAEGEYVDTYESVVTYVDTGANDFGTIIGDFEKDVFLLIINKMDSLISQVE